MARASYFDAGIPVSHPVNDCELAEDRRDEIEYIVLQKLRELCDKDAATIAHEIEAMFENLASTLKGKVTVLCGDVLQVSFAVIHPNGPKPREETFVVTA